MRLLQGAAAQLAGRLGSKDARRSDDVGSGSFGGGGRFARRGSESAAAERRSAQERLYSLDLDRVRAGAQCWQLSTHDSCPSGISTLKPCDKWTPCHVTEKARECRRWTTSPPLLTLQPAIISAGDDARTTLMVKNIPNKYTQKMLLATIDEHFRGTYDFFYLPIDFKNKCDDALRCTNYVWSLPVPQAGPPAGVRTSIQQQHPAHREHHLHHVMMRMCCAPGAMWATHSSTCCGRHSLCRWWSASTTANGRNSTPRRCPLLDAVQA